MKESQYTKTLELDLMNLVAEMSPKTKWSFYFKMLTEAHPLELTVSNPHGSNTSHPPCLNWTLLIFHWCELGFSQTL